MFWQSESLAESRYDVLCTLSFPPPLLVLPICVCVWTFDRSKHTHSLSCVTFSYFCWYFKRNTKYVWLVKSTFCHFSAHIIMRAHSIRCWCVCVSFSAAKTGFRFATFGELITHGINRLSPFVKRSYFNCVRVKSCKLLTHSECVCVCEQTIMYAYLMRVSASEYFYAIHYD